MSYQSNTALEIEEKAAENILSNDITPFEKHIIQCCKADEWDLRKKLKKFLTRSGFQIFEDGYKTERCTKEPRYNTVHNMLAIRGENPKVCLVAHTDVCRDHEALEKGYGEYHYWMYDRHENEQKIMKPTPKKANPILKKVEHEGQIRRIIQDRDCGIQTGGDDRLGVAINTYIALNTGYPMALYFPTDEEIGLKSARACEMQQLKDFELLVEVDRGNHSDELVIKISNEILCSWETAATLLEIAYNMGHPRSPITGMSTDVYALKNRGMCKNAVNMTCGYHSSYSSNPNEYIDVEESRNTLKYVSEIVKHYYMSE